jgi:hypothetical protein
MINIWSDAAQDAQCAQALQQAGLLVSIIGILTSIALTFGSRAPLVNHVQISSLGPKFRCTCFDRYIRMKNSAVL